MATTCGQMESFEASLRTTARADQLQCISAFVREAAQRVGFDPSQINRIELAVDEACVNVIQHAYAQGKDGYLEVRVRGEPGCRLVVTLIDQGEPFDPALARTYDPSQPLDESREGGFGLYLMRQIMDDLRFEFNLTSEEFGEKPFNRLTMIKHL